MIKGDYEDKSFTSIGNLQLNISYKTLLIFLCFKFVSVIVDQKILHIPDHVKYNILLFFFICYLLFALYVFVCN